MAFLHSRYRSVRKVDDDTHCCVCKLVELAFPFELPNFWRLEWFHRLIQDAAMFDGIRKTPSLMSACRIFLRVGTSPARRRAAALHTRRWGWHNAFGLCQKQRTNPWSSWWYYVNLTIDSASAAVAKSTALVRHLQNTHFFTAKGRI